MLAHVIIQAPNKPRSTAVENYLGDLFPDLSLRNMEGGGTSPGSTRAEDLPMRRGGGGRAPERRARKKDHDPNGRYRRSPPQQPAVAGNAVHCGVRKRNGSDSFQSALVLGTVWRRLLRLS